MLHQTVEKKEEEKPKQSVECSSTILKALYPSKQLEVGPKENAVHVEELKGGDIAVVKIETWVSKLSSMQIYSHDLSKFKSEYDINSRGFHSLELCPNGDITATHVVFHQNTYQLGHVVINRVLIDPLEMKIAKSLAKTSTCYVGLKHTCLVSGNQYIVIRETKYLKGIIKVYDLKTHEYKSTLDLDEEVRGMKSAIFLPNGKTVISLTDGNVVLFKYAEEKASEVKFLSIYNEEKSRSLKYLDTTLYPVSDELFLTISPLAVNTIRAEKQSQLQLWNCNTGERVGESVIISGHLWQKVKNPNLLDGSILCCTDENLICIIDKSTLKARYFKPEFEIVDMVVLANDQVGIISLVKGKYDLAVYELDQIRQFKKIHLGNKIMDSINLTGDPARLVAEYATDVVFPRNRAGLPLSSLRGAFFATKQSSAAPVLDCLPVATHRSPHKYP